ncbi:MAG: hypothetical protein K2X28_03955 [Alphaproteobacteria bacterium]|nr:hypothetical protein [Alphaproteobacteria bacterium]
MYLNKFFPIALSFILLSSSSKAMTPEEDSFGRQPSHPNYKAPFSDENMEEEYWALAHLAERDAYGKATGLNFYDLSKEERLIFVELSELEKEAFCMKKRLDSGR